MTIQSPAIICEPNGEIYLWGYLHESDDSFAFVVIFPAKSPKSYTVELHHKRVPSPADSYLHIDELAAIGGAVPKYVFDSRDEAVEKAVELSHSRELLTYDDIVSRYRCRFGSKQ